MWDPQTPQHHAFRGVKATELTLKVPTVGVWRGEILDLSIWLDPDPTEWIL